VKILSRHFAISKSCQLTLLFIVSDRVGPFTQWMDTYGFVEEFIIIYHTNVIFPIFFTYLKT
jgi:hypothetical protein